MQAWKLGLGTYLGGEEGVDGPATMGPRRATNDGPGLVVDPDVLVVEEGLEAAELKIRCLLCLTLPWLAAQCLWPSQRR
jgi:hypothetical protein